MTGVTDTGSLRRLVGTAAVAALLVATGGCGETEPSPAGMAMSMGDPDAVPAEEIPGAEVSSGPFVILDSRPEGYDAVVGTAALARHDAGTTVTVRLQGLPAGTEFLSHVHDGSCADGGGDHFRFDPDGPATPPNEIHLAFTSSVDGAGYMTVENGATAPASARSAVVHPADLLDNPFACADLG